MKDSQILSGFPDATMPGELRGAPAEQRPARVLVFDACHVGVVLRAVLFVEAVLAVAALFGTGIFLEWLARLSLLTGGALPATLVWLLAACLLKHPLARVGPGAQYAAGAGLGALAGLYGCGLLAMVGFVSPVPWLAGAASGALLSALLVAALVLRARGRAPAATAARLAELQSRIRPHFLFNTLNSAVALVRAEPARAEALLEDLADLFRHALADPGESVTLAEEVQLAERYLAIEQVRFGDRLRVEWAIDPAAVGARLPPLLLQPLVENAVQHGVEPSSTGGLVRIAAQRRGATVLVRITNTLPGTADSSSAAAAAARGNGMALSNVRDRLALMHDLHGRFSAGVQDGQWRVRIEIPA